MSDETIAQSLFAILDGACTDEAETIEQGEDGAITYTFQDGSKGYEP